MQESNQKVPKGVVDKAFWTWYIKYPFQETDKKVGPFLTKEIIATPGHWLRDTRQALFLSTGEMAKRLQVSRQAYFQMEKKEEFGEVTLKKMALAAEAMDCELIYAIRPKSKLRFSQIIWKALLPKALNHYWVKSRGDLFKSRALVATAKWTMIDHKFREQQNWTERLTHHDQSE